MTTTAAPRTFALPESATALAFSEDGQRLALGGEHGAFVVALDGRAPRFRRAPYVEAIGEIAGRFWLCADSTLRPLEGRGPRTEGVRRFAATGALVAVATAADVRVLEAHDLEERYRIERSTVRALDARAGLLALACDDGLFVHGLDTGERLVHHDVGALTCVALSPDGQRVVASAYEGAALGPTLGLLERHPECGPIAHLGDGVIVGRARLDLHGTPVAELPRGVDHVAFHAATRRLAFVRGRELTVVELGAPFDLALPLGVREQVGHLAVRGDGRLLAASERGGHVSLYDLEGGRALARLPTGGGGFEGPPIAFDRHGRLLVAVGGVQVWDVERHRRVATWRPEALSLPHVRGLAIDDDAVRVRDHERESTLDLEGRHLGTESHDDGADGGRALEARRGELSLSVRGPHVECRGPGRKGWSTQYHDAPSALAIHPRAERFYTASAARWLAERRLSNGDLRRVFPAAASGKVTSLAFDPEGRRLAVGEMEGRLHVWALGAAPKRIAYLDTTSLRPEKSAFGPQACCVDALAFPGALVVCAGSAYRFENPEGRLDRERPFLFESDAGSPSAVSEDGRRFLRGGGYLEALELLDASGETLLRLPGTEARDRWQDLSSDGGALLVGSSNGETSELSALRDDGAHLGTLRIEGELGGARWREGDVLGWLRDDDARARGRVPPFFRWKVREGRIERWLTDEAARFIDATDLRTGGDRAILHGAGPVHVIEAAGRIERWLPGASEHGYTAAALSRDGRLAALGEWSGAVHVFELDTGRRLALLSGTAEGGAFASTDSGLHHEVGKAARRLWGGEG